MYFLYENYTQPAFPNKYKKLDSLNKLPLLTKKVLNSSEYHLLSPGAAALQQELQQWPLHTAGHGHYFTLMMPYFLL